MRARIWHMQEHTKSKQQSYSQANCKLYFFFQRICYIMPNTKQFFERKHICTRREFVIRIHYFGLLINLHCFIHFSPILKVVPHKLAPSTECGKIHAFNVAHTKSRYLRFWLYLRLYHLNWRFDLLSSFDECAKPVIIEDTVSCLFILLTYLYLSFSDATNTMLTPNQ